MIPLIIFIIGISILIEVYINILSIRKINIELEEVVTVKPDLPFINIYSEYPNEGDYIGSLQIPALNRLLPVYQGTSEVLLNKGIGHFIKSALPGENNNTVLSGHRETYFNKLNNLVIGDLLIIETTAGIFTYQVVETKIVDKDDQSIIVFTDHSVLTLTTCYPFNYLGNAPKRFIVIADLIKK